MWVLSFLARSVAFWVEGRRIIVLVGAILFVVWSQKFCEVIVSGAPEGLLLYGNLGGISAVDG